MALLEMTLEELVLLALDLLKVRRLAEALECLPVRMKQISFQTLPCHPTRRRTSLLGSLPGSIKSLLDGARRRLLTSWKRHL